MATQTVEHNGARLAVESGGAGPPVIFLHAGVADRRMWAAQMAHLARTYRVVAYDRRGFGQTETANVPFSHVDDLTAVLDHLGIERAGLVGASQGGRIAIDFALAQPHRVHSLALIAPAVSGAPGPGELPPALAALDAALDEADEAGDLSRINEIEAHMWLDGPTSDFGRVSGPPRELFLDMNGIALAQPDLVEEIDPPDAYERMRDLAQPVLLLWGDLDLPHVQARCRYLAREIAQAQVTELGGMAHMPALEAPAQVNRLLDDFLAA